MTMKMSWTRMTLTFTWHFQRLFKSFVEKGDYSGEGEGDDEDEDDDDDDSDEN